MRLAAQQLVDIRFGQEVFHVPESEQIQKLLRQQQADSGWQPNEEKRQKPFHAMETQEPYA